MDPAKANSLEELRFCCLDCQRCGLAGTRQSVVFGEGSSRAQIFLLGEAPGAQEDQSGRPFVGRAGKVLDEILAAAGLERSTVFITGSVKCRPPCNRNPRRGELAACRPILERQLILIRPRVVICLGLVAVQNILHPGVRMREVRGRFFQRQNLLIYPTYHPSAVLRHTVDASMLIEDFRAGREMLGAQP